MTGSDDVSSTVAGSGPFERSSADKYCCVVCAMQSIDDGETTSVMTDKNDSDVICDVLQ